MTTTQLIVAATTGAIAATIGLVTVFEYRKARALAGDGEAEVKNTSTRLNSAKAQIEEDMAFLKDQLAAVEKSINIQLEEFGSDAIQTHITLQQQVKHLQAKLAELEQRRDQLTKENEKLKAEIQVQKPIMDEWVKEALVLEAQCREYEETRNTIQQASVNRENALTKLAEHSQKVATVGKKWDKISPAIKPASVGCTPDAKNCGLPLRENERNMP